MFGKVSEDSFRSIFDGSLFEANNGSGRAPNGGGHSLAQDSDAGSLFSSISDCSTSSSNNNGLFGLSNGNQNNTKKRLPFQQLQQQNHGIIGDNRSAKAVSTSSSSSAADNSKVNTNRYKTELCRPFQENGVCKYGEKCQFAHGGVELRTVSRHPKYKTDLCKTYHSVGFCPYGPRCHFIHNLEEVKPNSNTSSSNNSSVSASLQTIAQGSNSKTNGIPQLPMFSNNLTQEQLSRLGGKDGFSTSTNTPKRLRNPSESGYTSSGSSSSSSSSFGGDSSSEGSFSPLGKSRLPVFSTMLSK